MALLAHAQPGAVKLWPQLTPGIYNHANVLAMNCEVGADGLTVTDAAWDSYQVKGCAKRWTLNMGAPMPGPLKQYRFAPEFSGLPVNLTVEFYNPAKPWEIKENYQEILLLAGTRHIGLPQWFHIPTDRLAYDFDEGNWFPAGWSLLRGRYAPWQGAAKARQRDRNGQCPMYDFGFTQLAPCAMPPSGAPGTRERCGLLFDDNEWIAQDGGQDRFAADPTDPRNWQNAPFHRHAEQRSIIIPDFEAPLSHGRTTSMKPSPGSLAKCGARIPMCSSVARAWECSGPRSAFSTA